MKKWFKFFGLSFFSHKISKESVKRSYTNAFLGFVLALVFIWAGSILGDMLPFGVHYNNSPDFKETVHAVFANADTDKRIDAEIENGSLKLKKEGSEYAPRLLINTFACESDKQIYSVNGYNVVVDSRPASTLAEVEAYCISNDGKNTVISYEDYLLVNEAQRYNFDFKLRYTGKPLELSDEAVEAFRLYVDGLNDENKAETAKLDKDLAENNITKAEYSRAIYELYFVNYYPEITEFEKTSKVPLLRNYYYHEYISKGIKNYLFIFDDYVTGSFETKGGVEVPFYGFYANLEDGALVNDSASQADANAVADGFIKKAFKANWPINIYAYLLSVLSLAPFIALMLMVATLLTYSVLKLRGVESINTVGAMLRIVGSFTWFSGAVSAVLTLIIMFFVNRGMINVLPTVLFFVVLVGRSIVFAVKESIPEKMEAAQQKEEQTEV